MKPKRISLVVASILALVVVARPVSAGRPCVDNFSESGDWGSGKVFRSFVEFSSQEPNRALVALAQKITTEGYLGVSADKELGIVSAYQETNQKKSVISGTVTAPSEGHVRVEVSFHLAPGLRTQVKALQQTFCDYLEAAVPGEAREAMAKAGAASSGVRLAKASGAESLEWAGGTEREAGGPFAVLVFLDFAGSSAAVRTTDHRPVVLLESKGDPSGKYLLVRTEVDRDHQARSVKFGSAGQFLKAGVTGQADLKPDKGWVIPSELTKAEEGFWHLVPKENLAPGEYGVWDVEAASLAGFGVDP